MKEKSTLRLFFTNRIILTFVLLINIVPFQSLHAQINFAPISSSLGGAGIANLDQLEGAFLNPAILPHHKDFKVGAVFSQGSIFANQDDQVWGILASDCTTVIPGAFAYINAKRTGLLPSEVQQKFYSLSLASFVRNRVTLGLEFNRNESQIVEGPKFVENNFTLGLLYSPATELALGLVAKNLAKPAGDLPLPLQLQPSLGIGMFLIFADKFHFRADFGQEIRNNPEAKKFLNLGVETRPVDYLAIRWGFSRDMLRNRTLFTAGLGFVGPRLSAGYSFQNEIQEEGGPRHMFDFGLPF